MPGRRETLARDRRKHSLSRCRRVKEVLARQARVADTLRALEARMRAETAAEAKA